MTPLVAHGQVIADTYSMKVTVDAAINPWRLAEHEGSHCGETDLLRLNVIRTEV